MIEEIKLRVNDLLGNENSGHGMDHVNRVLYLALKFADKEHADKDIVSLIALLHDVDDYKLFGTKNANELNNAKKIMTECGIDFDVQNIVCEEIKTIGFNKYLKGIRPSTLEGKIVSDADMCDAIGAVGIIRAHAYSIKNGDPFFDKNIFPIANITVNQYTKSRKDTSTVCHMFEKLLKLKGLMLTEAGKEEAKSRHEFLIAFLYQLFKEENLPQWKSYLDDFLKNNR